jgi:hypothetical protein
MTLNSYHGTTTYPRHFEEVADKVLKFLPDARLSRTRDAIQVDYDGERGIIILITPESIEIRLPTTEWTMGSHGPALSSRLWKRMNISRIRDMEEIDLLDKVQDLISAGLQHRQREFKKCRFCGKEYSPEHMTKRACHGCASKHLGIVY